MRTIRLILAALLILSTPALIAQTDKPMRTKPGRRSLADIVQDVSTSIVRIQAEFSLRASAAPSQAEPNPPVRSFDEHSSGTGFIIDGKGRIATADHVVDENMQEAEATQLAKQQGLTVIPGSFRLIRVTIVVEEPNVADKQHRLLVYGNSDTYRAQIAAQDTAKDIAILSCESNLLTGRRSGVGIEGKPIVPKRTLPHFQIEPPRAGEAVSASGYPAVKGFEGTGIPGVTTSTGVVANPLFMDEDGRIAYLIDMRVNPGNSGGPVFEDTNGKVIGFVDNYRIATSGENSDLTGVVPIQQVFDLLATVH